MIETNSWKKLGKTVGQKHLSGCPYVNYTSGQSNNDQRGVRLYKMILPIIGTIKKKKAELKTPHTLQLPGSCHICMLQGQQLHLSESGKTRPRDLPVTAYSTSRNLAGGGPARVYRTGVGCRKREGKVEQHLDFKERGAVELATLLDERRTVRDISPVKIL